MDCCDDEARRIPLGTGAVDDDVEHRHAVFYQRGSAIGVTATVAGCPRP